MAKFLSILILLSSVLFLTSCASDDDLTGSPEALFEKAKEFDKNERYDEALRRYTDIKNKFPYNKLATESELAIADVLFKQESFVEAQAAYQVFRELHPKHPKSDYVLFRNGLSYSKQLPDTVDRDLSVAHSAIKIYDNFLMTYPQSPYAKEAKENKESALKMLAEKELYIADFYKKKEQCLSATLRYQSLLKNYAGLGLDKKAEAGIKNCVGKF